MSWLSAAARFLRSRPCPEDIPPLPEPREETPDWKPKKLPLWRKALAAVSGAGALAIFLYATGVTDLSAAVGKGGLTALGWQQLRLYLVFCGLLLVLALSIGRRTKPLDLVQVPAEKRRLSRRTAAAAVSILLLIPVTLFVGVYYLDNKQYGLMSVLVLLECMAPFFLVFEGRRAPGPGAGGHCGAVRHLCGGPGGIFHAASVQARHGHDHHLRRSAGGRERLSGGRAVHAGVQHAVLPGCLDAVADV